MRPGNMWLGSLCIESPQRPLCEALKVKPGLWWTPHHVRDARSLRYLPRTVAYREFNQPKRVVCDRQQSKRTEPSKHIEIKILDIIVCPAGILSYFGFILSQSISISPLWNETIQSASVCCKYLVCVFIFTGDYSQKIVLSFKRAFGLVNRFYTMGNFKVAENELTFTSMEIRTHRHTHTDRDTHTYTNTYMGYLFF